MVKFDPRKLHNYTVGEFVDPMDIGNTSVQSLKNELGVISVSFICPSVSLVAIT